MSANDGVVVTPQSEVMSTEGCDVIDRHGNRSLLEERVAVVEDVVGNDVGSLGTQSPDVVSHLIVAVEGRRKFQ